MLRRIASERPDSAYQWASQVFLDASMGLAVIDRAESEGVAVLGVQGFLVDKQSGAIYPALDRIADFRGLPRADHDQFVRSTCQEARMTIRGWSEPPHPDHSLMQAGAHGRHMLWLVLDEEESAQIKPSSDQ